MPSREGNIPIQNAIVYLMETCDQKLKTQRIDLLSLRNNGDKNSSTIYNQYIINTSYGMSNNLVLCCYIISERLLITHYYYHTNDYAKYDSMIINGICITYPPVVTLPDVC